MAGRVVENDPKKAAAKLLAGIYLGESYPLDRPERSSLIKYLKKSEWP